jgi:AraC-like DNA-binding protein
MLQFDIFSTLAHDPPRRIECWNEFLCNSFTPQVSDPVDASSFNAHVLCTDVDDLQLAELYSDAHRVRHSQAHIARTRNEMFVLLLQLEGEGVARQEGREAALRPGDFTICDTTRPYDLIFEKTNRLFVLGIPRTTMTRYLRNPESIVSVGMNGSKGMSGLVSGLLRSFWCEFRAEPHAWQATQVLNAALSLLAPNYAVVPQAMIVRSSFKAAHRTRILAYIEAHLADPDLTPKAIARACNITTRYLHQLFLDEPETVSRYILRRRLEECSKALNRTSERGRTVTTIALDYGFNSPTHFGRAFRARFGMTPREFRRGP